MKRLSEIEIAGNHYPLNFSVKAVRKICERYGAVEEMWEKIQAMPVHQRLGEIVWILSLLIEQGTQYLRITEGKELDALTAEELEVLVTIGEFDRYADAINAAALRGASTEVEVELPKNGDAMQGG